MEEEQTKAPSFESSLNEDDYKYLKELDEKFLNDFDPEDDTTNFTEQDYANLQHNLVLFKDGDREATEYIVKAFHRILHSYTCFIVLHKLPYVKMKARNGIIINRVYPSILNFIKLFSGTKVKERFDIKDTCDYIYSLFKKYEYGDIYNTLVLALLNMANKYKIITDTNSPKYKPNGSFHLYVKKCFHFEAFHFLKDLAKDPLLSANLLAISDEDENDYDDDVNNICKSVVPIDEKTIIEYNTVIDTLDRQLQIQNSNVLTIREDDIDVYSEDSLNFNWINGAVCGPMFKSLTPYERELLILSYSKNQTEDTLAALYGYSRSTIGSHKRRAIEKLKEAMNQSKEEHH